MIAQIPAAIAWVIAALLVLSWVWFICVCAMWVKERLVDRRWRARLDRTSCTYTPGCVRDDTHPGECTVVDR